MPSPFEKQENPQYVETFVGLPAFMSPFMQQQACLNGLVLKADHGKLSALCDKYLNQVGTGEIRYLPLFSNVLFCSALMKIYSLNPAQENIGWMKETDISFWLVTVAWKKVGDSYVPDHLAYFLPYLFVDNPYAIASGREDYGFNKFAASFEGVEDFQKNGLTANAIVFETLSKETEGKMGWLLKVSAPGPKAADTETAKAPTQAMAAYQAIVAMMAGVDDIKKLDLSPLEGILGGPIAHFALELIADMLLHLADKIPMAFLKQFRSISRPEETCYQAIIEAPIKVTRFYNFDFLAPGYQVHIHQVPSHPIAECLGLEATLADGEWLANSKMGFCCEIDFVVENGLEVAKSLPKKEKIAVLGGGGGSLSAALGLTETAGWQEKYDITVYQMGWRLGGKGASGRNQVLADRIEEHGLHIWFGFYENAFRVMQSCYGALNRPSQAPLATWDQAFKPHNYIVIEDYHNGKWGHLNLHFPATPGTPGIGGRQFWPISYLAMLIKRMIDELPALTPFFGSSEPVANPASLLPKGVCQCLERLGLITTPTEEESKYPALYSLRLAHQLLTSLDTPEEHFHTQRLNPEQLEQLKLLFSEEGKSIFNDLINGCNDDKTEGFNSFISHASILYLLGDFIKFIKFIKWLERLLENDLRLLAILIELGIVIAFGLLSDLVWAAYHDLIHEPDYDRINDLDFRAWLLKHGASNDAAYSAPVRAFYDLTFAYPNGDTGANDPTTEGNFAAGTAVHAILLIAFAYKGAVMWKMQAGMGDVVFTPLYQVLRQRGVKFKFFHNITGLIANGAGDAIEKIMYDEQVTLKEGLSEYEPLIDVKGLPCWPSEPLYQQIAQGDQLKAEHIDLESFWTPWQAVKPGLCLEQGKDFDRIICGIPISALSFISQDLAQKSASWQAMLEHVQSVRTLATQLWLKADIEQLGWDAQSPVLDAYVQPFNTWADMSQTLWAENWPETLEPSNVSYFCGPLSDNGDPFPPQSDSAFPASQKFAVTEASTQWLNANIGVLWPAATTENGFNWALLNTPGADAKERFIARYCRANINPCERYSLSVAGTYKYRLKTDGSDFNNLYLAGDWIDNGYLNAGCVEATVISGLQAAQAISGISLGIVY